MHNRRCSEAKPPDCRDAMHCVSTCKGNALRLYLQGQHYEHQMMYRRLRFATPTVMHIASLRD
ncbi:MAG: hypothetical protein LBT09_09870 [Planctomycetaceae bacterium]|nr:hypothetical protein [Planctomycetaceae bacterium]